ncbi:MAG: immunoglobulin-like domain-containing protein [Ignavibacteriales bacterium]
MKNKGFTLIELLAVIVILAILAAITVPVVVGIIDRAREASYKESVRSIFEAANIYIASEDFIDFPSEGINVTDPVLKIKNMSFTSGKVILNENGILELDKVSDGKYCAGGTLGEIYVIEGSCDQLDATPPTVNLASNLVTSNSITVVATGEDLESGMNGYQFSKDNGTTWTGKQTSNVYTFNNLKNNTDYTFKVKATNNNQLTTVSDSLIVRTNDIPIPTYSINTTNWVITATVTIHYPARETGYVYQYSLDNALTWLTVDAPATTKDITFTDNGNVIARILDGPNEIIGTSYIVTNIDKYNPSVGITVAGTPFNGSGWANANFNLNIQGTDNESGVKSYTYCQTTSATCTPTTVVNSTSGTVTITIESTTNKVCAFSTDNANNNSSVVCSDPYKLDKTNPTVVFGMNGNATYAKSRSTAVTVSDTSSGVLASSLEYQWTTSTTVPTEASFTTTFTSGGTLSTPAGVSGGYYLWILGKDNAGNTIITRSNVFNLDNTIPVITVNPTTVDVFKNIAYTDTGVTASDNIDGNITSSIITTGTVNTAVVGTYTLTYNVSDASGNVAVAKTRTVNVLESTFTFTNAGVTGRYGPTQAQLNTAYTGTSLAGKVTSSNGIQLWTVPNTGVYQIEVWGAQGGGTAGGKGARMRGDFNLTAGQVLKILVGQMGITTDNTNAAQGGGGSFVALNDNTPLIISGGGGGNSGSIYSTAQPDGQIGTTGGYGRDTNTNTGSPGVNGYGGYESQNGHGGGGFYGPANTTQGGLAFIDGGTGGYYGAGLEGGFGGGGSTAATTYPRGGGGGGYSGGGGARSDTTSTSYATAGGGGSYNAGSNQSNNSGVRTGAGLIVITRVS